MFVIDNYVRWGVTFEKRKRGSDSLRRGRLASVGRKTKMGCGGEKEEGMFKTVNYLYFFFKGVMVISPTLWKCGKRSMKVKEGICSQFSQTSHSWFLECKR